MAKTEDRLDIAISVIITAIVAATMIAYLAIPIITTAINSLTGDAAQYGEMLGFVLTMMIFALIILVVRGFNSRAR